MVLAVVWPRRLVDQVTAQLADVMHDRDAVVDAVLRRVELKNKTKPDRTKKTPAPPPRLPKVAGAKLAAQHERRPTPHG